MIQHSKQVWQVGNIVKVGFLTGLRVESIEPTPGDYAPDIYHLLQVITGRRYTFTPHKGIERKER
jgi:hypothetical protein